MGKSFCPYQDVFDRILYLIFVNLEIRQPFKMRGLEGVDTVEQYVTWLIREYPTGQWPNDKRGQHLYNYHQLLILFYEHHEIGQLKHEWDGAQTEIGP